MNPAPMSEEGVIAWLTAAGYRINGAWCWPAFADLDLVDHVFTEYERRTGYPLSVARGRTGSFGPLFAPRVVDLLGRGHPKEYKHRIVTALLDAVLESGNWTEAFSAIRQEFEGSTGVELVP